MTFSWSIRSIVVQDQDAGAPVPMDAAKHDPGAMIAELARAMKPERRGRFLDAACGGDARLRAEVEAQLDHSGGGSGGEPAAEGPPPRPPDDPVPGSVESIALDALNEAPVAATEGQAGPPDEPPIVAYCDQHRLD